jgi:hypothetical protein
VDLTNVVITDDKLGAIGSLPTFAVGATTTLAKTFSVPAGQASVDNTGSACGRDPLSVEVCATSVHHLAVTQVLGETIQKTPPADVLAVTGENTTSRSLAGIAFLLGGFAVISILRRRNG